MDKEQHLLSTISDLAYNVNFRYVNSVDIVYTEQITKIPETLIELSKIINKFIHMKICDYKFIRGILQLVYKINYYDFNNDKISLLELTHCKDAIKYYNDKYVPCYKYRNYCIQFNRNKYSNIGVSHIGTFMQTKNTKDYSEEIESDKKKYLEENNYLDKNDNYDENKDELKTEMITYYDNIKKQIEIKDEWYEKLIKYHNSIIIKQDELENNKKILEERKKKLILANNKLFAEKEEFENEKRLFESEKQLFENSKTKYKDLFVDLESI